MSAQLPAFACTFPVGYLTAGYMPIDSNASAMAFGAGLIWMTFVLYLAGWGCRSFRSKQLAPKTVNWAAFCLLFVELVSVWQAQGSPKVANLIQKRSDF